MDVGLVVEGAVGGPQLEQWAKVLGIREPAFLAIMRSIINGSRYDKSFPAQVTTGLGSADVWAAHNLPQPYYFDDPRFAALAIRTYAGSHETQAKSGSTAASLGARLAEASTLEQARELVTDALRRKTAEILQVPASEIDSSLPLYRYGVDSLSAIELRNWIAREAKANIALLEIMAAVPIKDFAMKIAEESKVVQV